MADYKQMYLTLLDATEKVMNELISAQRACEEIFIHSSECEEKEQAAEIIKKVEKIKTACRLKQGVLVDKQFFAIF